MQVGKPAIAKGSAAGLTHPANQPLLGLGALALQTHSRVQFHATDYFSFHRLSVWELLKQRVKICEVVVAVQVSVFVLDPDSGIAGKRQYLVDAHVGDGNKLNACDTAGGEFFFDSFKPRFCNARSSRENCLFTLLYSLRFSLL